MVFFLILLLVLVLVVFPIWAIFRIIGLGHENDALSRRLALMEEELWALRERGAPRAQPAPTPTPAVAPETTRPASPDGLVTSTATFPEPPPPPIVPPPVIPPPVVTDSWIPAARRPLGPRINWEQFTGAKLLAWIGGVLAFLGAAFFVKYSFEHDLIPPEVRVAIGYVFAIGLILGGLRIPRERYAITAHTLCATGIVCLYAVTFACNSIYHFAFFGQGLTFGLMTLITAAAFFMAVRLEAKPVAVLGMLGGFLTPVLLSTGRDNPPGLFGYITLLDVGLVAVALHRGWRFLVPLGAGGTILMQFGWAEKFLNADKAPIAMFVCLNFCVLFLAAYLAAWRLARRRDPAGPVPAEITWSAVAFPFVALAFAAIFLGYGSIAARPGLLFSFVLAADVVLLALACLDEKLPKLHLVAGLTVFALVAAWTGSRLTSDLLPWALAIYLGYAVLHTAFPLVLQRYRPEAASTWWSQVFPPLTLLLMLVPLFKLDAVSFAFWPCVLLIDLLAIGLALITGSLVAVAMVLVLTLVVTGAWLLRVPATLEAQSPLLLVVGGFAVLFFAAGLYLTRRLGAAGATGAPESLRDARAQIPAFSALLPFALLIMMTQRLPLANPAPLFGLALLLILLVLGLTVILARAADAEHGGVPRAVEWLPACALGGVGALEFAWHARHFALENAARVLPWYAGFYLLFALWPFAFRRQFAGLTGPWAVAALAGVVQFPLVYRLVERTWPNAFMGLLPALFAALPLASLFVVLRKTASDNPARLNQLAWFGGVALLFITLIFPIQFERQWITLGWALEGAALLWLFHRVPHPGLRATGVALLIAAFARLALNPFVLEYHARGATPLFNWYLYSYGITTLCLFAGVALLKKPEPAEGPGSPHERVFGLNVRALLATLGTVLAFLLVNIEIADFFSPAGARTLTFQFSGNFARDMTYTIAWALFALGLLLASIWKQTRAGRFAALGLLGVTVLKLFLHDLERLEALYRIGAFFAVAVIAIVASFAYQRFLPGNEKNASDNP